MEQRGVTENFQVKVNFWDLAGGQEYFEVRNEFYKDAQGVRAHPLAQTLHLPPGSIEPSLRAVLLRAAFSKRRVR